MEFQLEECSINSIVEKSLDLLSPEIKRMHISCRLDLAPAMALAYVDRDVLGQVCINLIRNAVAAIGKGGTLNIRTLEGEQSFRIDGRHPFIRRGTGRNRVHGLITESDPAFRSNPISG